MTEFVERALAFFSTHSRAYRQVFNRQSPAAQYVLADLAEFAHANDTTMRSNDPLELARNEGRRQVFLRIQRALNLTPDEMFNLARQKKEVIK